MTNRLLKDESGVALGLAIVVVVLVGVMGAALLVLVSTDLRILAETNQGQRAFEAAEAGAQAARAQLAQDPDPESYDARSDRWRSGVEVRFDGNEALVTIEHLSSGEDGDEGEVFRAVSTGAAGEARRKIEAHYLVAGGAEGEDPEVRLTGWRELYG